MPDTRHLAPFELLRFTAAPVSVDVSVVEIEGRFPSSSRFPRQPVLVVEDGDRPRSELVPVHSVRDGERWSAVFAVPLAALDGGTFALGVRGTLLDLPAPDLADDGDRLATVAREANAMRRLLEAAQDAAAAARAEAEATAAELGAAVTAARDEAETAAADRIAALERSHAAAAAEWAERIAALEDELAAAHRVADEERQEARRRTAQEVEAVRAEVASAQEAAYAAAVARADDAEARANDAEARLDAADARVEAAEARVLAAEQDASAVTDERTEDAEARAEAADAGVAVLRAELAEERERSQATIADLQVQLEAARAARGGEDPTAVLMTAEGADAATSVVGRPALEAPVTLKVSDTPPPSPSRDAALHRTPGPTPSRWFAVAALALFFFVLLGLLLGFLA